ncbi:MAG TPA: phosphotransferase [Pseudonocardiaceae bacterium]|jgi:fructokinase|nr:phosphotransferase [Pseudonocardiaceae bacterium]
MSVDVLDGPTRDWLREQVGADVVLVLALTGGFTNENLLVRTDGGEQFVLRRFRRGNSCAVEAALARRLRSVVAVPAVVAAEPDASVAGQPLLLSEFVPGELLSVVLARGAGDRQLGEVVGAALTAIGGVRFDRPGLFTGPDLRPDSADMSTGLTTFVADCLARSVVLSERERVGLLGLAERAEPGLAAVGGASSLVHSDFNAKNILVRRDGASWRVAAVLDWEFAFSGHPLGDVGNMLRFRADLPDAFVDGFVAGLGELPPDWARLAADLDLFALADLLTRPADHPLMAKVLAVVRQRIAGTA